MSGRNSKISPERIKAITDLIAAGNYASIACQCTNISEATYYNWLERGRREQARLDLEAAQGITSEPSKEAIYVEFLEGVKKAEGDAEMAAVLHVRNAMHNNWQAAMTYLERKFPERWGRRDKSINVNVETKADLDLSKLSDDELFRLNDLMAKADPDAKPEVQH